MKTALRALAAVFAGLLLSFILVVALEPFSAVVHPPPEDFGGTSEEMYRHVQRYPHWVLAVVVPAWAVAAFVGTRTARRIGNLYSSATVGLLLLAALVFNISLLPYPIWFKIANLLAIPIAVVTGSGLPTRHNTAGSGEANLERLEKHLTKKDE
jgi:hypothetical protein